MFLSQWYEKNRITVLWSTILSERWQNAFLAVQWNMKALPGSKCQASVTNCEVFAEVGKIYSYNYSWMEQTIKAGKSLNI